MTSMLVYMTSYRVVDWRGLRALDTSDVFRYCTNQNWSHLHCGCYQWTGERTVICLLFKNELRGFSTTIFGEMIDT